jgi:hypothetical protein
MSKRARAVGASVRYPLKRIKCVGGPCKTLKLGEPYPKRIEMQKGAYILFEGPTLDGDVPPPEYCWLDYPKEERTDGPRHSMKIGLHHGDPAS